MDINKYFIDIESSGELRRQYIETLEPLVYKVLCVYESCDVTGDFEPWDTYLDWVINQMIGTSWFFEDPVFVTIASVLIGLSEREHLTQKKVKTIVFGCCKKLNVARGYVKRRGSIELLG